MAKTVMGLNADDFEQLSEKIGRLGTKGENAINEYLRTQGAEKIIKGITPLIPVSKRGTSHARHTEWWEQKNFNLAIQIANSTKGKAGGKYGKSMSRYYLYFVDTGTGTSKFGRNKDFMARGLNNVYDSVVTGLVDNLTNEIQKEL